MQQIGRYQIIGELGRGAMGVVYRALDPAIGRTVALKSIRLAELADPAEVTRLHERLMREAQSAGLLSHPGIVTIFDVAEHDGQAYVAMEFVNGPTLEQLLSGDSAPLPKTVLRILRETAAALDYAHKKGIVHRDIKPANVMIDEDGTAKITDFGVAKVTASQQMTQAGTVIGTPSYMSPEQIQGKPVDGRSDQFSLAVIAYEMLTGEKPFFAEQLPSLVYKIVHEDPPPPQRLNPSLGWQVEVVLHKAMEKDPEDRYPACTDFVTALEGACNSSRGWQPLPRGGGQDLPTTTIAAADAAPGPAPPVAERVVDPAPARRWRRVRIALVSGTIVVALTLLFSWSQGWFPPRWETTLVMQPPAAPPPPAPAGRPSPSGPAVPAPRQEPQPGETAGEASTSQPAQEPSAQPPVQVPAPQPPHVEPAPGSEVTVLGRTSPPGATVTFDGNPITSCKSPCSLPLALGRHTASATLDGHRSALRIFEAPREVDIFLYLAKMSGQVQVLSDPPGASIFVNGEVRQEKTPAIIDLPVGKYTVAVSKEGYKRDDQDVEMRDSGFVRVNFKLGK